jgi:endonuclease/exonuclease/phosphatase family metal-dependent hydrolase
MIKIITLNLNYCGDKHGSWADRRALIAEILKSENPDIVAFQAVCTLGENINQAEQIAEDLNFQYRIFCPVSRNKDGRQEGNAVISRFPVAECEHLLLSLNQSDDTVQRLVQKTVFNINDEIIHLYNAHFSWVKEQTIENLKEAIVFLNSPDEKAILVGDFNSSPDDKVLEKLKQHGWTDLWEFHNREKEGYTFESDKPFTRIDYVWINKNVPGMASEIKVVSGEKDKMIRLSDHNGLAAKIKI